MIDFGGAAVGDPAVDVAAAWTMGDPVLAGLVGAYPKAGALVARADFIRGSYALQEALHGARHGDDDALAAGLAEYRD